MTLSDCIRSCRRRERNAALCALFYMVVALPLSLSAQQSDTCSTSSAVRPASPHRLDRSATYALKDPAKAALYSSVLPGLGQAYNGKYWKIPLVYALIGTSGYFVKFYNDKYRELRKAFITRINGGKDAFQDILTTEQIADRSREYERDRNLALVFTTGFYLLNIIDALVDANLSAFNVDKDLSLSPVLIPDPKQGAPRPGIAMRFRF